MIVDFAVLRRSNPFESGLRVLPIFYFVCIAFNVLMVTWDGSKGISFCSFIYRHHTLQVPYLILVLHFNEIPVWGAVIIALGCGFIAAMFVQFFLKPRIHRKIQDEMAVKSRTQCVVVNPDLVTDRYIIGKEVKDAESGSYTSSMFQSPLIYFKN
ncbi:unnamed protein product [Strongylus vulgaris]|uniref:Uncharacterized protein n=1 Tax=Strongylus vulgaris TaxID=40348 RepID=A0A3P7JEF5_STRVU|nr:unnamed protein product [Strongylus vulgaris]